MTAVPVVDLAADGDVVAAEIGAACRSVGFFTIVGHGVDDRIVADLHREALAFFALPAADRMATAMGGTGMPYGYSPPEGEALQRSLGDDASPDLKETFNIGPIDATATQVAAMDDPDQRAIHAPTPWPDASPGLRPAAEAYYRAMASLAARLMSAFAVALELPPDFFAPLIDRHGSALRLAHYPPIPVGTDVTGRFRAGAHTDYGTLTILWTDGRPGLQVEAPDGAWIDVDAVPGSLIVNLGDLMQRWTNDRWRSTMHRVVPVADGVARLSVPFFHNANWDARVECLVADGERPHHPPTTAGRHLMGKFRSTQT